MSKGKLEKELGEPKRVSEERNNLDGWRFVRMKETQVLQKQLDVFDIFSHHLPNSLPKSQQKGRKTERSA